MGIRCRMFYLFLVGLLCSCHFDDEVRGEYFTGAYLPKQFQLSHTELDFFGPMTIDFTYNYHKFETEVWKNQQGQEIKRFEY